MSSDMWRDVSDHYLKLGYAPADGPPRALPRERMAERLRFLQEELAELGDATAVGDLADQVDALVDLVVVALGTAAQMRVPWAACWDEVLRANLAKVPGVGKRGMALDLVKPPGWTPPDHQAILRRHGYDDEVGPPAPPPPRPPQGGGI